MIVRHPDCDAAGSIHADNVIADDNPNDGDDATCTKLLDPLNDIAPPYRPDVDHDAPTTDPVFPFPDTSATDEPDPASNEKPNTNPAGTGGAAGVATPATELIAAHDSPTHRPHAPDSCNSSTLRAPGRGSSWSSTLRHLGERAASGSLAALHPIRGNSSVVSRSAPRKLRAVPARRRKRRDPWASTEVSCRLPPGS